MNILGISAYYHDAAAVLLQDGKISCALQEERFSRIKHDPAFPCQAIQHLFRLCPPQELDYIAYYEKPLRKFERIIDTFITIAPRGISPFRQSIPTWASQKIFLPHTLKRQLKKAAKASGKKIDSSAIPSLVFPSHHESHAASAFFPSPFHDAAILSLDGVGEWSTLTYGTGSGHRLDLHAQQSFPHSLGLLYSAFTTYCGFRVNSGEYKLMGLAPYGTPKYTSKILDHLLTLHSDGSFHLDLSYFGYLDSMHMVNGKFEALFGRPTRKLDGKENSEPLTTFHMDIAASIQEVTETIILTLSRHIQSQTGQKNLCLAGGVALNCVANGRLQREGPFDHIWIQPAAGDAGGALGAALFTEHQLLEKPRQHLTGATGRKTTEPELKNDAMQSSQLGTSFSDIEILEAINTFHPDGPLPQTRPADQQELHRQAAALIADEQVVARFDGRMEFGPRALGNRSILGDPRSPRLQSVMNQKIKFREDFRPFAPLCLAEHVADYFTKPHHSPYMLSVSKLLEDHRLTNPNEDSSLTGFDQLHLTRSTLPAITHVNHSARLQTLTTEANPALHDLLSTFHQLTGCPMLINTSFNVRGEPIVQSPQDALRCFLATDIDALILGPFLLTKDNIPEQFLIPRNQHLEKFQRD